MALKSLIFKKISILLFVCFSLNGCFSTDSLKKVETQVPSWYLNVPLNNTVYIYGEGESKRSLNDAKNNALNSMASKLVVSVQSSISSTTQTFRDNQNNNYFKDIKNNTKVDVKKINFTNAITHKSEYVNGSFYVLMKVNRIELFKNKKKEFDIDHNNIENQYSLSKNYTKLEQINILQKLYPLIENNKQKAVVLHAINNDFDQTTYLKKYDLYLSKTVELKKDMSINIRTNNESRYFSDSLITVLNKNDYRVSYNNKSDIVISLNNKVKYSITRGWNIAKVSTTISVLSNNKIITNTMISSLGRSSTSKQSALENASQNFLEQIEEKTIDKVIFTK